MKQKKQNALSVLLEYAGSHRRLTLLGLGLSAVSMVCSMIPYLCIWLAARDLIAVAPDWTQARSVTDYGWIAFAFAVGGILIYFLGLMCTHLAAFRTASNIRKQGIIGPVMNFLIFKVLYKKKANWQLIRDDMILDNMYLSSILTSGKYPERIPADKIKTCTPRDLMKGVAV